MSYENGFSSYGVRATVNTKAGTIEFSDAHPDAGPFSKKVAIEIRQRQCVTLFRQTLKFCINDIPSKKHHEKKRDQKKLDVVDAWLKEHAAK